MVVYEDDKKSIVTTTLFNAPELGFEPRTTKLTVSGSTIELFCNYFKELLSIISRTTSKMMRSDERSYYSTLSVVHPLLEHFQFSKSHAQERNLPNQDEQHPRNHYI